MNIWKLILNYKYLTNKNIFFLKKYKPINEMNTFSKNSKVY